ncbi:Starch-binding associating with outer membrane [Filimonas lacunae]|uniref:Starch-binding associating with outer membrane n=1 Tax=Filimonas lacunae TaxID=477680 RepID=A0A173M9Y5_9BACT|nr:RagB/SusD family nutrient uptake outer membrane protein [Filimonas lacunae]BAV04329.1 outer membrane protein, nutrient binding [Filimonas lacunae]SIT31040.1 Starch-binding associating with outer membrane [Filimonas lacunae]
MKRIYIIIVTAIISLFIFSACNKSWLNPAAEGQLSSVDSSFLDPANAQKFVNACYTQLLNWDASSFAWIGVTSIASDDADKGSSPGDVGSDKDQMDAITWTPTSSSPAGVFSAYFLGVNYCNEALFNVPKFKLETSVQERYLAEAKFLRAYYYFTLVRTFGDVPYKDTVVAQDDATIRKYNRRVSKDSIYALIESDLKYAISILPTRDQLNGEYGRASKGAATGLLAKVSMYEKKWQQAYDLTNQVINQSVGTYSLVNDYATIWREVGENSEESLFEIQSKSTSPFAAVQQYSQVQGIRGGTFNVTNVYTGWGFNTPSTDLDNAFEPGDVRRKATIIHIGDTLFDGVVVINAENAMYNYKAYPSNIAESYGNNTDYSNKNIRILRMGDIYLINAEAANELGSTDVAQTSLNKVRNRAKLGNTTATTQADLRNAIWKERRVELAMEHDRWYDLVRQGRAGVVMRALGKNFVDGKHEVFPIPQTEINSSNNVLTQNPGY